MNAKKIRKKKENGGLLSEVPTMYSMRSETNTSASKIAKMTKEPISAKRSWPTSSLI